MEKLVIVIMVVVGRGGAVGNILGIKRVLVLSTLIFMDNLMDIPHILVELYYNISEFCI